ncbi:hypothetical protein AGMMS49992_15660 [Clostridia bacterium]|nr:hypothetical protein AGMMS49992_15660 [Clostridia bacterium]
MNRMRATRDPSPQPAYVRAILWIAIASIVIVAACAMLLSSLFSRYALDEVSKVNEQEVRHTVLNVTFMLEKLRANAIAMYEDPQIHAWLVSDHDDPIQYISATERLSRLLSGEAFIKDSYLINLKRGKIFEHSTGLHALEAFGAEMIQDWIEQGTFLRLTPHWIDGQQRLLMIVPSTPSRQSYIGYVVLALDTQAFETQYLRGETDPRVVTVLSVGDEMSLPSAVNGAVNGHVNEETIAILRENTQSSRGTFLTRIFDQDRGQDQAWLVHYDSIQNQDWVFYRMMRMDDIGRKTGMIRNLTVALMMGLLAMLLAALFWHTRRTLRPLGALANRATDMMRTDALRQWIQQGYLTAAARDWLNPKLTAASTLRLGVMRIESYQRVRQELDFATLKQRRQSICEAARGAFANAGLTAEAVDMGADSILLIINCQNTGIDAVKRILTEVQVLAKAHLDAGYALAIGPVQRADEDLRRAGENIYELSVLKFIWGEDKVYDEVDFEEYMSAARVLPDDTILDQLIQCVRAGSADGAVGLVDRLTAMLRGMTYTNCKFYLTLCVYTIYAAFSKFVEPTDVGGIHSRLDGFDSLESATDWLREQITAIANNVRAHRKTDKRSETVLEIVEYIDNNLHNPSLSPDDVAEHVSLSVRYLGQIFKESLDTTPAEYILTRRLNKVERLLRSTDNAVGDIAADCGFISKSHFFTAFKKATSMTPSQYRQAAR